MRQWKPTSHSRTIIMNDQMFSRFAPRNGGLPPESESASESPPGSPPGSDCITLKEFDDRPDQTATPAADAEAAPTENWPAPDWAPDRWANIRRDYTQDDLARLDRKSTRLNSSH